VVEVVVESLRLVGTPGTPGNLEEYRRRTMRVRRRLVVLLLLLLFLVARLLHKQNPLG
jgi:hypothetical protein